MDKPHNSLKHNETRPYIPSQEEKGYEQDNPLVQNETHKTFPLNPIIERGQDPELVWKNKYGETDDQTQKVVEIRSLYRTEHIAPERLIERFYTSEVKQNQFNMFASDFHDDSKKDELDKPFLYYNHQEQWTNRLIQGDSLHVMTSLLERENLAGRVQCIYFDPPYGIKYGSNWQIRTNDRNVKDNDDNALSHEPQQIKAFRDTWELGIHSYLAYLRDRLLAAHQLLTESGSIFLQISDENVHLVRCILDEVFGSENFVSQIIFRKTGSQSSNRIGCISDVIIFYAKNIEKLKFNKLYNEKILSEEFDYDKLILENGEERKERISFEERMNMSLLPKNAKVFQATSLQSDGSSGNVDYTFEHEGKKYFPSKGSHWKTSVEGLKRLAQKGRLFFGKKGGTPRYIRYYEDFPLREISNVWMDVYAPSSTEKQYVVQTAQKVIQRCILMTTDVGDLVLDPTCGSGTTAHVAEQWGRRWITTDTSRIALNIAKTRLMTALYPYYKLKNEADLRQGFIYKTVPHITLKSLANDEPAETETLYDQPEEDKKVLRVAGAFTVECLQSDTALSPEEFLSEQTSGNLTDFEEKIFSHLRSAGVKGLYKEQQTVFAQIERLDASMHLHAEGYFRNQAGEECKAYIFIGGRYSSVDKKAVNEAIKEARNRGDADWLLILGFAFESDVQNSQETRKLGKMDVTKIRMHDDLLQEGLTKKDKKAGSFVLIGEPDIQVKKVGDTVQVEILGMDIYNPQADDVISRDRANIAYWMLDEAYNGNDFFVNQAFFCGGDKDEFDRWKKSLNDLAKSKTSTKKNVEKMLKIELEEEAFERAYGFLSHPIAYAKGKKIAVRVISHFGEECTKILIL